MAGAIASFSLMAIATREVGATFDTFEIMLYRGAIGVALVTAALAGTGTLPLARPRRMGLHLLRNAVHFAGQNLWLFAIGVLPLAQVIAIEFTSPLWVLLLAPVLLGERLTARGLLAGVVGFAGVLVVAQPGVAPLDRGLLAAAACALCFALTALATKRLTRTEPVAAILFWLNVIQLGLAGAIVAARGGAPWPGPGEAPWLVAIGVAGSAAHWCLTSALRAAPASVVMPLDFLRLPVIAGLAWLLYGEAVGTSLALGSALILFGNLLTLRADRTNVAS
jgi:drug/metabolite transporter (DMT)-like permease